jgi:hypothetical protein
LLAAALQDGGDEQRGERDVGKKTGLGCGRNREGRGG